MSESEIMEGAVSRPRKSVWKILGTIIKVLFVIVLGTALGVALFLGLPELYRGFMVPVRQNAADIADLQSILDEQLQNAAAFRDETAQAVAGYEGKLAELTEQNAEFSAALQLQEDLLQELRDTVYQLEQENTALQNNVDHVQVLEERVSAIETSLAEESQPVREMRLQIQIVRVLEMINHAQTSIGQENFGSAQDDLQLCAAALDALLPTYDETQTGQLENARAHIELALAKLPDQPRLATTELDLAWAELLGFLEPAADIENTTEAVLEETEPQP